MTNHRIPTVRASLAAVLLLAGFAPAAAQIPDEFTNLEVLPKDIGKGELIEIMRNFAGSLGVRCNHCHVGEDPRSLEGYDFASDEPEPKRVARAMMAMTDEINGKLLAATGREDRMRVRCSTCHRGLQRPEGLDEILLGTIERDGVEAAVRRYRELRDEHYGTGSYDFGAGTLNGIAEKLAERQDLGAAITVLDLNVEMHPDAAYSLMMLGQANAMQGNKEAAVAALERALELEPDNPRAKAMLERLRGSE